MVPSLAALETYLAETNFAARKQKMFPDTNFVSETYNKSQIVFGLSDCFRTPSFCFVSSETKRYCFQFRGELFTQWG